MANGLFAGGDGTELNPYLIEDADDLNVITGGTSGSMKYYKIVSDLDMNGYGDMFPISNNRGHYISLDGNNRDIINSQKPLVGYPLGSTFKNIRIIDCDIEGNSALTVGSSTNSDNATFRNCYISGKLTSVYTAGVGGIASRLGENCLIENCVVELDIEAPGYVGGLYGQTSQGMVIKNSIARGRITQNPFSSNGRIGGIGGSGEAQIVNSYSNMEIVASTNFRVNGLIGYGSPIVTNSYWNKDIVAIEGGISENYGLTTQQMQTAQTFIDAGWDLELNDDGSPVWILEDGEYPKLWFEAETVKTLIKSNSTYYTYQDNEFTEVEPTTENFELHGVNLSVLLTLNEQGVKPIFQLPNPEIVTLTDLDKSNSLYIRGFKNILKSDIVENPILLMNSTTQPQVNTVSIPKPQLILPKSDIVFKMLDKVENFEVVANPVNTQNIKIIFSLDSGETWKTFNKNELLFEGINITNLEEVKLKGIDIETFNSIGVKWDEIIKDSKIRFGYYLEVESVSDVANIDRLDATIDMQGSWKSVEQGVDYNYGYGNDKIYIRIYRDGSYKINYN